GSARALASFERRHASIRPAVARQRARARDRTGTPVRRAGPAGLLLLRARRRAGRRAPPGAAALLLRFGEAELPRQGVLVSLEHEVDAFANVDGDGNLRAAMKKMQALVLLRRDVDRGRDL